MTSEQRRAAALALRWLADSQAPTVKGERAALTLAALAVELEREARAQDEEDEARAAWAAVMEQAGGVPF